MAAVDTFPRGAFPEYTLNCELTGGNWMCEAVEAQCSSAVEFGVVCKSYEDLCNECLMDKTQPTCVAPNTVSSATSPTPETEEKLNGTTSFPETYIAGIGILAALLVAVTVGWILSCIVLLRRIQTGLKQQQ